MAWPELHPGSRRGWYNTPALYNYDPEEVSRDLFAEACISEGVPLSTSGYTNWHQTPLFQDMNLFSQLWVVKHANGVEYKPLPADALPNNEALRRRLVLFPIPATEAPELMDQMAAGVEKVAATMTDLAQEQRRRSV